MKGAPGSFEIAREIGTNARKFINVLNCGRKNGLHSVNQSRQTMLKQKRNPKITVLWVHNGILPRTQ